MIVTTTQDKYKYLTPDRTTVTATYIADTGNRISWTDADGAAQYMIQKADKPDGTYETVHTASVGEDSWMDADGSKREYYRVVTSNIIDGKTGFTAVSNVVSPQMPFEDVAYNAIIMMLWFGHQKQVLHLGDHQRLFHLKVDARARRLYR